jgi:putative transport protein
MDSLISLLAENQLVLLFTVIGLGYLLGSIRILGFSLGVAAVLFVGIAAGALDRRLSLPEPIYIIGLVLFVYAVGLQSGPGYFASFKKRGFKINLVAATLIEGGAVIAVVLWKILHVSAPNIVGLFCGALTNTPALAATVEAVKGMSVGLAPDVRNLYLESPVVTYSLAYPFGVFGVILWFYVFTRLFKVDFAKEEAERLKEGGTDVILSRTFKITNPAVDGKTVEVALKYIPNPGFVLSRIKKGVAISVVLPETVLSMGDQVVAVGNTAAIERARILFGEECAHHLPEYISGITYRRIFVSSKEAVGKTIEEVQLAKEYEATITRLRRGDVDFVPSPDTVLELGDQIRVVSKRDNLDRITQFFGDSLKSISETDFLSVSLGIVLGVLVGMFPFPLPNGTSFKLGFAGGPLIVALVLGRLQRTGPITWGLPFNANLVLRQIGLVFFLAAIGTRAGGSFGATLQGGGLTLIAAGALITTGVTVATMIVGYKYLKLPMSAVMGMMSGMQTQPACLAYANQQAQNELPNLWYATVYPVSMVTKIILAQIIVSMLLRF